MPNSQSRRWRQCAITAAIIIGVAICIVISFLAWVDHTIGKPHRVALQIGKTIESLATKCPSGITKEQWDVAVFWTYQLTGNSLLIEANLNDLRCFQRELEKKVQGKVDMDLIFWIWDEHAKLTHAGLLYKQRFQQMMLDEMQGKR
jgi:hypothetical protein